MCMLHESYKTNDIICHHVRLCACRGVHQMNDSLSTQWLTPGVNCDTKSFGLSHKSLPDSDYFREWVHFSGDLRPLDIYRDQAWKYNREQSLKDKYRVICYNIKSILTRNFNSKQHLKKTNKHKNLPKESKHWWLNSGSRPCFGLSHFTILTSTRQAADQLGLSRATSRCVCSVKAESQKRGHQKRNRLLNATWFTDAGAVKLNGCDTAWMVHMQHMLAHTSMQVHAPRAYSCLPARMCTHTHTDKSYWI